jgi:hypothetical protein
LKIARAFPGAVARATLAWERISRVRPFGGNGRSAPAAQTKANFFRRDSSMRLFAAISLALVSMVLALQAAKADVRVTFVNSYRYGELQDKAEDKRLAELEDIRHTLEELGARYLSQHEVLKIEVLDIATVALMVPGVRVRPSQFELQYVLQKDGKIILQDREGLSDVSNLENPSTPKANDPMVYEKEMLRDWFAERFGSLRPSGQ